MIVLLEERRPVARVGHGCNACLDPIEPGTRYVRQRIVDGGDAWVWRAHERCHDSMRAYWADQGYDAEEIRYLDEDGVTPDPGEYRAWLAGTGR